MRAIDKLKKAADLELTERTTTLSNGEEFSIWCSNLTMAEREKSQRDSKSDDANQYALQLLVQKAKDQNGNPMFAPGEIAELKHDVEDGDLQKIMLLVIERNGGDLATKRPKGAAKSAGGRSTDAAAIRGVQGAGADAEPAKEPNLL